MNIYTAERDAEKAKLVTVLVERVKGNFKNNDAVLVVDPFPDAHFGHTIIVFLIDFVANRASCHKRGNFYFSGELIRFKFVISLFCSYFPALSFLKT